MNDRVNTKDRIGVNAFEGAVLKELKWIFREQPTIDVGIDATIEKVQDGNPTGKQIAVQIKSGMGNVTKNKDGNFDYYISCVHYEYWLSYPIPVIIVLYDDENDLLYWNSVFKRNMSKTKGKKNKITFSKDLIISSNSISDLEDIINIYQSKLVVDDDFDPADGDELLNYCSDLMTYSSESLVNIRKIIQDFDSSCKKQEEIMQMFIDKHPSCADQKLVNKTLKLVISNYKLGYNIFRTRISSELPILVETHVKALLYTNKYIFPYLREPAFADIADSLIDKMNSEVVAISSLKEVLVQLSAAYKKSDKNIDYGYAKAQHNASIVLDDYVCELDDLVHLIDECIITIRKTKNNDPAERSVLATLK